jgi:biopolymer transport protein ExbB
MLYFLIKGGPVMIPIILGSVLGLAIIIEKFWMFHAARLNVQDFMDEAFSMLRARDYTSAIDLCAKNSRSPVPAVFKAGIEKMNLPAAEIEKILERAGNAQVKRLEKHIGGLISVIGIEPLLGFLGTITGLIRAFMAWERAGSNITVSALASGIYEAMITTAAGLIVAVPYYLVCNYIISRVKYYSYEITDSSMQLVETIAEIKGER